MKTPVTPQPTVIGENVLHFARILRATGFALGPDRIISAMQVLALVGVGNRNDMHSALSSVLVDRHENQPLFDSAFNLFWDHAGAFKTTFDMNSRHKPAQAPPRKPLIHARLPRGIYPPSSSQGEDDKEHVDAVATFSAHERLCERDFESMTNEEFDHAARLVRDLNLPLQMMPFRRKQSAKQGRINLRGTLQGMLRQHDTLRIAYHDQQQQEPPLVVLLDVSGSMERYARIFLHFTHGLARRYRHVNTLVFGTQLTNISRCLRGRDVDVALRETSRLVPDWRGGTRIGSSLREFNRLWARRLLGGNATLLLVSDGLDCDNADTLSRESERLRRLARQIIWLNPLLRFDGFEPRAEGIRTLLPMTDQLLPVHNVKSLAELGAQIAQLQQKSFDKRSRGHPSVSIRTTNSVAS